MCKLAIDWRYAGGAGSGWYCALWVAGVPADGSPAAGANTGHRSAGGCDQSLEWRAEAAP